jgi:hypothetical protein
MRQKRIFVPTRCVHDWRAFLTDPETQWEPGYSAMSVAYSWENAGGLPEEIAHLFEHSGDPELHPATLVLAIPEYKVSLKGGPRPSQNDVLAVLSTNAGLVVMSVEAKAREDFDKTLGQWRKETSDKGYKSRLGQILECIGLKSIPPDETRYQLLHRTASAVLEARRFHARVAVMVVQSFVDSDKDNHFADYKAFLRLYGQSAVKNRLIYLADVGGIRLFSGWVQSKLDYTERKISPNKLLRRIGAKNRTSR